ncbi:hypothetical protein [Streptomyces sp. NPDC101166]|uniref:hypothetical protein n=1 Tax=Streptomyces sp. NPDC101166 TaxID=3366120 RepID=UPI003800BB21
MLVRLGAAAVARFSIPDRSARGPAVRLMPSPYQLIRARTARAAFVMEHRPRISEDQHFGARAYLHSKVMSLLGDYDCYPVTAGGLDLKAVLEQGDEMADLAFRQDDGVDGGDC